MPHRSPVLTTRVRPPGGFGTSGGSASTHKDWPIKGYQARAIVLYFSREHLSNKEPKLTSLESFVFATSIIRWINLRARSDAGHSTIASARGVGRIRKRYDFAHHCLHLGYHVCGGTDHRVEKCDPSDRVWPGPKCNRCAELGLECSENQRAEDLSPSRESSEPAPQNQRTLDVQGGQVENDEWKLVRKLWVFLNLTSPSESLPKYLNTRD